MENRRMILLALIGVILFMLYQAWQADYARPHSAGATPAAAVAGTAATPGTPATQATPATDTAGAAATTQQFITVQTDRFAAEIPLAGGGLRQVALKDYAADRQHPDQKLALLDDRDDYQFTLLDGLAGADKPLSSGQSVFTSAQTEYKLADGSDTLDVPLEYSDADGYSVRKVYHFKRGSYEIGVSQTLVNKTSHELQAAAYLRYQRTPPPAEHGPSFMRTSTGFAGVGVYQQDKPGGSYAYNKTAFNKLDEHPFESKQSGGWITVLQHYFVTAIIPPQDQPADLSAKKDSAKGLYQAQFTGELAPVASGAERSFDSKLYIGPVLQGAAFESVAPRFDLVEDYGVLTIVAKPLFSVLSFYHRLTGNWGWAIILLTLTVKGLFFKLSEAQYRSSAKMRKFGPRIKEMRERFGDDRERLNKAMMDLYKKEGFNPLAGCWPLLVQMPVFFALYWVLNQSVELRQAPFVLWVQDLAGPDPTYVLPVLYGISMWVQQRLSGQSATMDPQQAKIMNIMPIFLTGLFLFFPVGLVLYWLVSNLTNIFQQWFITRRLEREEQRKKEAAKS
jgi:YidC/Oxa1 family membrane protein insertase